MLFDQYQMDHSAEDDRHFVVGAKEEMKPELKINTNEVKDDIETIELDEIKINDFC